MRAAAKFLFDTSFDTVDDSVTAEPPAAPETAEPPPASYGAAELAAAREQGYAEGRREAEAEAAAAAAKSEAAALQALNAALPGLAQQMDEGLAACGRIMVETALSGLGRLMPELVRRGGLEEIDGLLQQALTELRDESRVVVRLRESLLDGLRARLDDIARGAGFEGRLVLLADDEIDAGDCRIEWAEGGVERTAGRIWSDIEGAVMRALTASYRTTPGTTTPGTTTPGTTTPGTTTPGTTTTGNTTMGNTTMGNTTTGNTIEGTGPDPVTNGPGDASPQET